MAEHPLQIGDVATAAGVSVDTVRYYERERLLPAAGRTEGGFRLFRSWLESRTAARPVNSLILHFVYSYTKAEDHCPIPTRFGRLKPGLHTRIIRRLLSTPDFRPSTFRLRGAS